MFENSQINKIKIVFRNMHTFLLVYNEYNFVLV